MCAYICINTYTHIYIHACTYIFMSPKYIPKCKDSYNIYTYTYMHAYTHASIGMYVFDMCIYVHIYTYMPMHVYLCTCICHTGVVYDNISVMFMLWALSINNKVGLVLLANIYLRHQSVVICRRWLYSLI